MKRKVLLVDDDFAVLAGLAGVLVSEGYDVVHAANGEEAIERFRKRNDFDIVLLDLYMPGRDGWDTFEQITSTNPLIPVIVITARPDQYVTAVAAGVGALMEKPLDLPILLQTMEELMRESTPERLARQSGRNPSTSYCPAPAETDGTALGRAIKRPKIRRPLTDRPQVVIALQTEGPHLALDRLFQAWFCCDESDRQVFLEAIQATSPAAIEQSSHNIDKRSAAVL